MTGRRGDAYYFGLLAAVLGLVEEGTVAPGARVLFVHTGGLPAIFAYQEELATGAAVQAEP